MTLLALDPATERRIAGKLWDGETILWRCRPARTRLAARRVGSALGALALTAFGAYALFTLDDPILAVVVAIAGLGVVARFALTHWIGVGTVYVVTNRRVISMGIGSDIAVKWMSGRELKSATCRVRPDGSGDLKFERHLTQAEQRAEDNPAAETFVGIPDVKAVFELVHRTFVPPAT